MRPIFHAELVNGDTGDPALFVDILFAGRAFLFDLGDLSALAPKKMLRLSAVFVSHAHMDHFIGFDRLLRVLLGRGKILSLFGPPGIARQVEAKLSAYTWNLIGNYASDLVFIVSELHQDGSCDKWAFSSRRAFRRESLGKTAIENGIILDEPFLTARFDFLNHEIPCLAYSIEEKMHANIWKNRLAELGLKTGPWLRNLREAVIACAPDDAIIDAEGRKMRLGELWGAVRVVPGQKLSYVTDADYDAANLEKIADLADCSDILYIEAVFLDRDGEHAKSKHHLTAVQAGSIGKMARAKSIVPFHFSPRYSGMEDMLKREVCEAFSP
jgi:ribonuclease Z